MCAMVSIISPMNRCCRARLDLGGEVEEVAHAPVLLQLLQLRAQPVRQRRRAPGVQSLYLYLNLNLKRIGLEYESSRTSLTIIDMFLLVNSLVLSTVQPLMQPNTVLLRSHDPM